MSNCYSAGSFQLRNRLAREIPQVVVKPQDYDPSKPLDAQISQAFDNQLRQLQLRNRITYETVEEVPMEQELGVGGGGTEETKVPEAESEQQKLGMRSNSGK